MPDTTWISLGAAIASGVGVMYAIFRGIQSSKNERKKFYVDVLFMLENNLSRIKEIEPRMDVDEDKIQEDKCYRYASDYLNILERISFLDKQNIIDGNMLGHLRAEFAYGLKLIEWKTKMGYLKGGKEYYSNLQSYTKKNEITIKDDDSDLPMWLTKLLRNRQQNHK